MKIGNFGLINMARSRVPFLAPPPWRGHEHPVDHLPPPPMAPVVQLRSPKQSVTRRVADSG
jgi:hypothetical protein